MALPALALESPSGHPAPRADYLGPGLVLELQHDGARVRLDDGSERVARLALAFAYRPVPNDELLVIGKDAAYFVIGLLRAAGPTTLEFPGDVELRSLAGKVEITGAEGVEVRGPSVGIYAEKMKLVADAVSESVNSLVQRVRELWSVQAGELRHVVRGLSHTQAKQAQLQTEENVSINGRQIHLG